MARAAVKKVRVAKEQPVVTRESESDSDSSEFSSDSEAGLDEIAGDSQDEFDEDDEVDDELDESSDEETEKKRSKFDDAMTAILGSKIKAHDRENPVLIRNKKMAKEIEGAKLDAQARRQLRLEKLQSQDRARVKNIIPDDPDAAGQALQAEKRFRKTAQRGVVRLMNALRASQVAASSTLATSSSIGVDKKSQEVAAASKDSFLDMIRSG